MFSRIHGSHEPLLAQQIKSITSISAAHGQYSISVLNVIQTLVPLSSFHERWQSESHWIEPVEFPDPNEKNSFDMYERHYIFKGNNNY